MRALDPQRIFPATAPAEPVYCARHASARYLLGGGAFAVFLLVFLFYAARLLLDGQILSSAGLLALAGITAAALALGLYRFRWLRSGYAISAQGIHFKAGFFMRQEYLIPFSEIEQVDVPMRQSPLTKLAGSLRLSLHSGRTRLLGDVHEPLKVARLVAERLARPPLR